MRVRKVERASKRANEQARKRANEQGAAHNPVKKEGVGQAVPHPARNLESRSAT